MRPWLQLTTSSLRFVEGDSSGSFWALCDIPSSPGIAWSTSFSPTANRFEPAHILQFTQILPLYRNVRVLKKFSLIACPIYTPHWCPIYLYPMIVCKFVMQIYFTKSVYELITQVVFRSHNYMPNFPMTRISHYITFVYIEYNIVNLS